MELLEEVYTRLGSTSPSMSFVFRKVLEEGNDEAVDKCKTHTHTHTFLYFIQMGERGD